MLALITLVQLLHSIITYVGCNLSLINPMKLGTLDLIAKVLNLKYQWSVYMFLAYILVQDFTKKPVCRTSKLHLEFPNHHSEILTWNFQITIRSIETHFPINSKWFQMQGLDLILETSK